MKSSRVIEAYASFKSSYVSTGMAFMWAGVNLRVPLFLLQSILVFLYILLSFKFGPLLLV